jgi:hypothetical protein
MASGSVEPVPSTTWGGHRRIAVLYDYGAAEAVSFIREPIAQLAAEGFEIDLVTPEFHPYPPWTPLRGVRHHPIRGYTLPPTRNDLKTLCRLAVRGVLRRDYAAVLATPIVSVVLGRILSALWRVPLVVLSDELYTRDDRAWNPHPRWRRIMNRAHTHAALTVITDLRRTAALVADSPRLRRQRYLELPSVPAGIPPRAQPEEFRRSLGLPEDTVLLLHAGQLSWFMRGPELLATLPSLPVGCALVVQMNHQPEPTTVELCRLVEATQPFRFLAHPLPYERLDEVVTACDIGVAFYCGAGPNFALCGKGSGKVNRCLRAGKPVIVDSNSGLDWIAEYGAAVAIHTVADLPAALRTIMADYDTFAARALQCHREHLSFEGHWPSVRRALVEVIDAPG